MGTKAPYYGSIAVAASLGRQPATVLEIPLSSQTSGAGLQPESAYAIYTATHLTRLTILNMRSYNTTLDGAGLVPLPSPTPRGEVEYAFLLEGVEQGRQLAVRRLLANGSDAITGITWDGWSYNYELDQGRPVRLGNVTVGERVVVGEGGVVKVRVADASAVVVEVGEGDGQEGNKARTGR